MRALELLPQFRRAGCQLGRARSFFARRRQRLKLLPNFAGIQIRPSQIGDQVGVWLHFFDIASRGMWMRLIARIYSRGAAYEPSRCGKLLHCTAVAVVSSVARAGDVDRQLK